MKIEDIKRLNAILYSIAEIDKRKVKFVKAVIVIIGKILKSLFSNHTPKTQLGEIHFVAITINNYKTIKNILDVIPAEKRTVWNNFEKDIPINRIHIKSLRYLPLLIKLYRKSPATERYVIKKYLYLFFLTCAAYKEVEKLIQKNPQLKMVVMPNDHYILSRAFIELSEKYGFKTLYLQHASVSKVFPNLHFTYAFLDGKQSYDIYKSIGDIKANVYLTGSPRFDAFFEYQGKGKIYDLGIALNQLDDINKVLSLCIYLKQHYSGRIIVRPHAGMIKVFNEDLFKKEGFDISNPNVELSYIFLSQIRFMIANESGIHLDAALMHVPSLLFNFSDVNVMDWYSFIKNGLVKYCRNEEEVIDLLMQKPSLNSDAIRYYSASFESPFEGKIGVFIADFIMKDLYEGKKSLDNYISSYMVRNKEYSEFIYS